MKTFRACTTAVLVPAGRLLLKRAEATSCHNLRIAAYFHAELR